MPTPFCAVGYCFQCTNTNGKLSKVSDKHVGVSLIDVCKGSGNVSNGLNLPNWKIPAGC